MSKFKLVGLMIAAAAVVGSSAEAHHSFAMFDAQKTVVLDGVVKEFQWTNPHSWIQVMVKDATGKDVEWSIEAGSPNALARRGWKRSIMKPGDKVKVTVHPMRDGTNGASLMSVVVNGTPIGASPQS